MFRDLVTYITIAYFPIALVLIIRDMRSNHDGC